MPFQTAVNVQPAPGIAGDFASTNPRSVVLAGQGGLIAGAAGVSAGLFAWISYSGVDNDNAAAVVNNFGSGNVAGLVGRQQQGLITSFLADSGMLIPSGFAVTPYNGGDFFVKNDGSTQAAVGQKAYANVLTGKVSFAAAGSPPGSASVTGSVAASTFSATGSITGNVLTVTAVGSGTLVPGATISGTSVATGSMIVSQLSGTTGGIGTYAVSIPEQTVASTTISGTYGTMTVTAVGSGTVAVGSAISGTNVVAGTAITANGTGTGGTGTYIVNNNTVVSSTTITAATNVETKFFAASSGAAGEVVKISGAVNVGSQG